jgi:phenol hydroxylase P3 protein
MGFTEVGDPTATSFRSSQHQGERYNFCSDGCKWIFDREPWKYIQAWLPVHQIYQGNCGGATIPEVLAWYGIDAGADNGEYTTSPDAAQWEQWHQPVVAGG